MTTSKRTVPTSEISSTPKDGIPRQSMRVQRAIDLRHAGVIRPLPMTAISTVTSVRSTLLSSSLLAVRESALLDAYTQALPLTYHDQVLRTLAPVWLPLEAATAHYQTMDSLCLPEEHALRIGRSVGDRLNGTFLRTLIRGVRHAGITPWSMAEMVDRVWSRVFDGGAIGVTKLGPKDALISIRELPLLSIDYFRVAFRGVLCAGVEAVAQRCYVRERGCCLEPSDVDYVVSWV